jgi:hypothetical protein
MQTNRHRDETIFIAFQQILRLIADSLRTLNVDFESRWKIIPAHLDDRVSVARIQSMPMLTSLKVAYYALFHSDVDESMFLEEDVTDGDGDWKGREAKTLFPSLKYLDLAEFRIPSQPPNLYGRIAKLAPALTHLRLPMNMASGLEEALGEYPGFSSMERVSDSVEGARDVSDNVGTESISDAETIVRVASPAPVPENKLPMTLQRVYVQLCPPLGHACCCGSWRHHTQEQRRYLLSMEQLRELERRDERVILLVDDVVIQDIVEEDRECQ